MIALMKKVKVEFWWRVEKLSGWLWDKACPDDQASCWLDFLPAWAYQKRKEAELERYEEEVE